MSSDTDAGVYWITMPIYQALNVVRGCVGIHLAKNTLWMAVASMLATMKFDRAKDELGNGIDIPTGYSGGLFL